MQHDSMDYGIVLKDKEIGGMQITFGYLAAIVFGLFLICGAGPFLVGKNHVPFDIFFLIMAALGVLMIVQGTKRKKFVALFMDYEARLTEDTSISQLAAYTGVSVETATENIEKMIQKGYFVDVYVDYEKECLVSYEDDPSDIFTEITEDQTFSPAKDVVVTCYGCGAANTITEGTVGKCEYCGNALAGE